MTAPDHLSEGIDYTASVARATKFAAAWAGERSERASSQTFWDEFFQIYGLRRADYARFEYTVARYDRSNNGRIDLFWRGKLVVEHKSANLDTEADLDTAYAQALQYYNDLEAAVRPQYIVLCNFKRFRILDLRKRDTAAATYTDIRLEELPERLRAFDFFYTFIPALYDDEEQVNKEAAHRIGTLHTLFTNWNYRGQPLELLLTRLLFCFFAEDTYLFPKNLFTKIIREHTTSDGSNLADVLHRLFVVLNTKPAARATLPELIELHDTNPTLLAHLDSFGFVNGNLFEYRLNTLPHFHVGIRETLLNCCRLDWSVISPAIFGTLFQEVMQTDERRQKGAHYTAEENILKTLEPLFIDDLRTELATIERMPAAPPSALETRTRALTDFQTRLTQIHLLDPACGCGNFLVVAYRQLRLIEIEVFRILAGKASGTDRTDLLDTLPRVTYFQLYGIELNESATHIARLALVLTEHQCNLLLERDADYYTPPLPLKRVPNVYQSNALRNDWANLSPRHATPTFDYIIGNPPFVGKQLQTAEQKADIAHVCGSIKGVGNLDLVAAWYIRAAAYIEAHPATRVGFVSTNSIAQGEQVGILWKELFEKYHLKIQFAHQTFEWSNEDTASGIAAVHCVIIGFGKDNSRAKLLFKYPKITKQLPSSTGVYLPIEKASLIKKTVVPNISPYLTVGSDAYVVARSKPLCDVAEMVKGSQPTDDGNYLFTPEERATFLLREPNAAPLFRRFVGAYEYINGVERWCLWLKDVPMHELRKLPRVLERIERVRDFRLKSTKEATTKKADTPALFDEVRQPDVPYLIVPSASSENRNYVPIGFLNADTVASNACLIVPNADVYLFGILTSKMHNVWMRYVCGRLKSDYRYSNTIVYNNFAFPKEVTTKARAAIITAAQKVLEVREGFLKAGANLASLYDPRTTEPALLKAHLDLDRTVDKAYRAAKFEKDDERIEFLFSEYEALITALETPTK